MFMITLYENACCGSVKDMFSLFQLLLRIYVEYTFGEVDMRWSIFWKKLYYDLEIQRHIIDNYMRLHNFIVDWYEKTSSNKHDNFRGIFARF